MFCFGSAISKIFFRKGYAKIVTTSRVIRVLIVDSTIIGEKHVEMRHFATRPRVVNSYTK